MQATYKTHMGNDAMVADAARVSFSKQASKYTYEQNEKLINYLAKHGHWSPFSHPQVQFHIKAPQFVARQCAKHVVGFAWNEVSRRYVSDKPEFYIPGKWRKANPDKKQGSLDEAVTELDVGVPEFKKPTNDAYVEAISLCEGVYQHMLLNGVAPEQARMVLPQSAYTEWMWTGSLYAWARACNLRLKPDAQLEIRKLFEQIDEQINLLFPVSWNALVNDSK